MSLFLRRFCSSRSCSNVFLPPHAPHFSTATRNARLNFFTGYHKAPFHTSFGTLRMLSVFTYQAQVPPVRTLTPQLKLQARSVVNVSKRRGKKKTVKAVAKRFHRTGSGKLKYWPAGKVHNMLSKSRNHRRRLRKPRYATKTQLKTLNKMISGW